jgi:hypothetical protein
MCVCMYVCCMYVCRVCFCCAQHGQELAGDSACMCVCMYVFMYVVLLFELSKLHTYIHTTHIHSGSSLRAVQTTHTNTPHTYIHTYIHTYTKVLPFELSKLLSGVVVMSMALTPALSELGDYLGRKVSENDKTNAGVYLHI